MNALMSRLPPIWREAVEELWRRRLRTLLTLLGLIFGVGAIVAMQAVGEGSRREALRLVEGLGLHNLIAEARQQDEATLKETRQRSLGLTVADADAALAVVPGAEAWAAEKRVRTHSVFSDHGRSDAQASGVSADWFRLSSLQVAQGRALDTEDEAALAAVAVLGHQAAADLFPGGNAVGGLVKVNHAWLEVVGVLADRDLGRDSFEGVQLGGESNSVYMPLSSARARLRFQPQEDEIDRFLLRLEDPAGLAAGAGVLAAVLDNRHAGIADYQLVVPQQLFQQHQQTQRIFQVVMGAIAVISLVVGGIGIMNIMLVSVTERIREIGLRMAVGAGPSDVRRQFLAEALLISLIGGIIGIALGAVGALLVGRMGALPVQLNGQVIGLAAGFSIATGLFFGYYPARKASQLDPIEALRQ